MKMIFAHDHVFYKANNGLFYSKGKLTRESFDEYRFFTSKITIVSRTNKFTISDSISYEYINDNNYIEFIPFDNLSDFNALFVNRIKYKNLMDNIVKENDFLIARLPSEIGLLAIDSARRLKKPYVIEFVACPWDGLWNYGGIISKLYAPLYYLRNKLATKVAPAVIYVTNFFLQNRYPTKGLSFGLSDVILKEYDSSVKSINTESLLKIGLIGALYSPHKGIDIAIEAIIKLNKLGIQSKLKILGPGEKKFWLKRYIDAIEFIDFDGFVSTREQVDDWLKDIDLYIQPSVQEGLPRAVIEAMNLGIPIIGSNVGGLPELIEPDFLVNKNDANDLVAKIILAIDSHNYTNLSNHSLTKVKNYSYKYLSNERRCAWEMIISKLSQ